MTQANAALCIGLTWPSVNMGSVSSTLAPSSTCPCDLFMDITKTERTGNCQHCSAALIKDHVSPSKLHEVR